MTTIVKTDSTNLDFQSLVKELDAYLKTTDGDDHDFYNQYNGLEDIKHVLVAYVDEKPIGCGAIKKFDTNAVELKRMYVKLEKRGSGIAKQILTFLEEWAKETGFQKCMLETGRRQVEAVKFYEKSGYKRIPNYGQYVQMENSICFKKTL
tara:strand:+ start:79458 stop:79907 length:450 start_codon:yes stop_codon:yes gene_type:complete